MPRLLPRLNADELSTRAQSRQRLVEPSTLQEAKAIVDAVRNGGDQSLAEFNLRFDRRPTSDPMVFGQPDLQSALERLPKEQRELLVRTARRIESFAQRQRGCLMPLDTEVMGGRAGHELCAVERAGVYAPGGRYPLPSSVLMGAVTAKAAGVDQVWVASPNPNGVTLAAAAVAGADALLAVGGAQAIAALSYGTETVLRCDAVVGPGNRYVTAAKKLVAGDVIIDMLAGPSELLIIADQHADPEIIAADLLAQAEHDPEACPGLITLNASILEAVEAALADQLVSLPTQAIARDALANGFAHESTNLEECLRITNLIAPEHLQIHVQDAETCLGALRHYGALFKGALSAEVFGDYGVGPNHVLPTRATARMTGGLSVMTFLRIRTWLELSDAKAMESLIIDTAKLARLEGLEGHARAAERRREASGCAQNQTQ